MREIKFRARHSEDGKWFYGTNGELKANDETVMPLSIFWHLVEVGELDRETVGQFTGFKDKNSKEIYEGDIIEGKLTIDGADCFDFTDSVSYQAPYFLCENRADFPLDNYETLEVIGNIYENPELTNRSRIKA